MKRLVFFVLILSGIMLLETPVLAQKKDPAVQTTASGYIDANGDGVCDNFNGTQPGKGLGPGNGKGLGSANGKGLGKGQGLRDGSAYGQRRLDGSGQGMNRGFGRRDGSGGRCLTPPKK